MWKSLSVVNFSIVIRFYGLRAVVEEHSKMDLGFGESSRKIMLYFYMCFLNM